MAKRGKMGCDNRLKIIHRNHSPVEQARKNSMAD